MPTSSLPENPSLEHLKGQAKLVRDLIRAGDPGGLSMIDEFHPRLDSTDLDLSHRDTFKTTDAQLIVARMYRFGSWNALRDHVGVVNLHSFTPSAENPAKNEDAPSFVRDACLDYAEDGPSPADRLAAAHRMLADDPLVATGSVEALATVGDHQGLAAMLDGQPGSANEPCGPNGWPPLLYAVYSRVSTDNPDWSAVETVKVLLDRGADANSGFLWRGNVPPFTALTGTSGGGESNEAKHAERLEIARLLLDAGADPNDGQLLHNGNGGKNHDDPTYLELLVEYGLGTQQNGPWYQRFGKQLRDPAELLYDELEAAAKRNRPNIFAYLASLKLDLNREIGRSQQTPARIAAAEGHDGILAILAEAGINIDLTPAEIALQHTRINQTKELQRHLAQHAELLSQLRREHPGLCNNVPTGDTEMLSLLIELGFDINDRSGTKTPLHHAAEANDADRARFLIGHGADPNLIDTHIHANPWGWANHFGNIETAAYLHPLTNHEQTLPEFSIQSPSATRTLVTPDLIDSLLDRINEAANGAELVQLKTGNTSLSIGLGRQDCSVAMYLDSNGDPWHAVGDPTLSIDEPFQFASYLGKGVIDFFPTAAITVESARSITRDFVADPAAKPANATWVIERAT